jgi:enoyl-CoA hydratase
MATIRVDDRRDGVRMLVLDAPPANALAEPLLGELGAALDDAALAMDVRALVLTGQGRFFSGGFDLKAPRRDAAQARLMRDLYHDVHVKLLSLPKPTVAMVNGHAIAGGMVLALACDCRLGRKGDYQIGLNEVAIGASFPKVAFEIVRLRLSHARASELMLGAALYPASEGLRLGFVDELLSSDNLESTVLRRAAGMGAFPRQAYAHTKAALIRDALARSLAETEQEAEQTAAVWTTEESRAARAAQRQKLSSGR